MKIQAIINRKAGSGKALEAVFALKDAFGNNGLRITETECRGHAGMITRRALEEDYDLIIAVGGDGTANEVANAMIGSNARLGIIPCGKANDLAEQHGISCNPYEAVKTIIEGHSREIDCICVNGLHYLTTGGIGLGTEVVESVNSLMQSGKIGRWIARILGSKVYSLAIIRLLLGNKIFMHSVALCNGHNKYKSSLTSLIIGNQPILAKHFRVFPRANNNDGLLDVCMIRASGNRFCLGFTILQTVRGRNYGQKSVDTLSTDRLILKSEKPLSFFADGEIVLQDNYFDIKVLPEAIKLLIPDENGGKS